MELAELDKLITAEPDNTNALTERGMERYRRNLFGDARNDFRRVTELCPDDAHARQMIELIDDILEFRYKDIYNP